MGGLVPAAWSLRDARVSGRSASYSDAQRSRMISWQAAPAGRPPGRRSGGDLSRRDAREVRVSVRTRFLVHDHLVACRVGVVLTPGIGEHPIWRLRGTSTSRRSPQERILGAPHPHRERVGSGSHVGDARRPLDRVARQPAQRCALEARRRRLARSPCRRRERRRVHAEAVPCWSGQRPAPASRGCGSVGDEPRARFAEPIAVGDPVAGGPRPGVANRRASRSTPPLPDERDAPPLLVGAVEHAARRPAGRGREISGCPARRSPTLGAADDVSIAAQQGGRGPRLRAGKPRRRWVCRRPRWLGSSGRSGGHPRRATAPSASARRRSRR
ncbi:MAG: hypothetical protein QOG94_1694 [Solirubrobacteraceae bacterium]|nr:hypothetical protein [Solirubrobacteraceae bacterium]